MINIRATMLESFRRFRDQVAETYDNEQLMIEKLSGKFIGNNKTEIGSAFHEIIEFGGIKETNVNFSADQIKIALNHFSSIHPFIPEVAHSKTYKTSFGEIQITGHIDVLEGNTIRDTKTKFRSPEYLEYYNSFQWRIYLSMFGLNRFLYDIFEFVGYKDEMAKDVSKLELKQHDPYECLRYDNMETDILILLNDFMEWVEFRNLKYLLINM